MYWYKFASGTHHLAKAQTTMFGYGTTVCGLKLSSGAVKVTPDNPVWPPQLLSNVCKRCLKGA